MPASVNRQAAPHLHVDAESKQMPDKKGAEKALFLVDGKWQREYTEFTSCFCRHRYL